MSGPIDEAHWNALWVAEYQSVREESGLARAAQQTILQWSLASFAAIIAGTLVLLKGDAHGNFVIAGAEGTLVLFIVGVTIPAFAAFASFAWWGEVFRMERAGQHLRRMEKQTKLMLTGVRSYPALSWESRISRTPPYGYRKIKIGYAGAVGIYAGMFTLGCLACHILSSTHRYEISGSAIGTNFKHYVPVDWFDSPLAKVTPHVVGRVVAWTSLLAIVLFGLVQLVLVVRFRNSSQPA